MRHHWICAVAASIAVALSSPVVAATDPTYAEIRASAPDGRTIDLNAYVFERDVLRFNLTGKLHLLAPVEGKTSGAVFIGNGSYELKPASSYERRQLAIHTGDEKLTSITDKFESAVFLGTALVAAAEKDGTITKAPPHPKAVDRWADYVRRQKRDLHTNIHIRLLQELLDDAVVGPFFFAWVDGKTHPPAVLIVDPRGAETVRLAGRELGGEQTMMTVIHDSRGGIWYSSRYASEITSGVGKRVMPPADADHYLIDATIRGAELTATTTLDFTATADVRVLPVDLTPQLTIADAAWTTAEKPEEFTSLPWIQEDRKEDADAAVVFPSRLRPGGKYRLRLTYSGREVLENAGDGNFTITRRMNWYPNVGVFNDLATYELRFRTPEKFQIIAVGDEVENRVEGDTRIAVWKSPTPLRVAGFNYGRFKKSSRTDEDSGITFDVYTNPGTPDILHQINYALEAIAAEEGGPSFVRADTARLAQAAMADGINTARTGNAFFGTLHSPKRVAITQQSQWFFGQSWPGLVYMPYVAFLDGTTRNTLGLNNAKDFVDNVGAHELAHQWWGHQVGTRSYHDEWISEGFAEFTAALVAHQTGGWDRYRDFFEKARRRILERPRGAAFPNNEAGPIAQGYRLATSKTPGAYDAIVYSKGAFVLHMLRMAMFGGQSEDAKFMAMMTDFANTFAGKNASTSDFQRIVEKHITDNMKLTANGNLDWFFGQWVYGTEIPKLSSKFDFKDVGGGKYKVTGSVTQSEVSADFATVVPIYVSFDKNSAVKVANIILVGAQTKPLEFEVPLPKKPQKFSINVFNDVLSR